MIASAFRAGTGGGRQIEEYLTQKKNREVAPELFRGDMSMTRALIDSSHRRWTYTHGVLAFHANDNPTDEQLEEITTDFEGFMFAGKDTDTFDITWVKHQDKGNTEVHFVVPRTDLETGQDLNIAPPGYDVDWAIWVASINHKYGFVDPFEQSPKATKGIYREHPDRAVTREEINGLVEQQVAQGHIKSREGLIEWLKEMGEVTRINEKFISLKTDKAERAFRLKGAIFESGFDFSAGLNQPRADPNSKKDADEITRKRAAAFEQRREFFERLRARSKKLRAMKIDEQFLDETEDDLIDAYALPEVAEQNEVTTTDPIAVVSDIEEPAPFPTEADEELGLPALQMLDFKLPDTLNEQDSEIDFWWTNQYHQWPERAGLITLIADTHPGVELHVLVGSASKILEDVKTDSKSPFSALLPKLLDLAKRTLAGGWKLFKGLAAVLYRDHAERHGLQNAGGTRDFGKSVSQKYPPPSPLREDRVAAQSTAPNLSSSNTPIPKQSGPSSERPNIQKQTGAAGAGNASISPAPQNELIEQQETRFNAEPETARNQASGRNKAAGSGNINNVPILQGAPKTTSTPSDAPRAASDGNMTRQDAIGSKERTTVVPQDPTIARQKAEASHAEQLAQQAARERADQLEDFADHWVQAVEDMPTPSRPATEGQPFFRPYGFDERVSKGLTRRGATLFSIQGMEEVASWERLKLKTAEIRNIMHRAMARWVDRIVADLPATERSSKSVWHGLVGDNRKAVDALTDGLNELPELKAPFEPVEVAWNAQDKILTEKYRKDREQAHKEWLAGQPARDAAKAEAEERARVAEKDARTLDEDPLRKEKEEAASHKPSAQTVIMPNHSM